MLLQFFAELIGKGGGQNSDFSVELDCWIKKNMQILWGLALYFLITCIGTEQEKVRQDVTDYKLELKISVCMIVNFEFRILYWNLEFWLNLKFRF